MNDQNLQNRNEVKEVKFHHRVKRFYHKNLFRKIYTVAIIGLVVANIVSMVKYSSLADDVYTFGEEHKNDWGGGGDMAANGFDSGNPRSERQGPCPEGWHVPSRGERNAITIAWCHYSNNCYDSDLLHGSDWTNDNNLIYINKPQLGSDFKSDFGMSHDYYWSSSPEAIYDNQTGWPLHLSPQYITTYALAIRSDTNHKVRCLKNTFDDVNGYGGSSTPSLTTTSEGYVLTDDGKSYTLALNDLDGYYYRGASENTDNTTWVDPNEGDGNGYGYGYGSSYSSCHYYDIDGNQQEVDHGSSIDLFSSILVSSGDSCYNNRHNVTCDDGTFTLDGSEYSSTLYDYCEEEGRNTAGLTTNDDGSKTITYNGKSYRIASGDLDGIYRWGNNIAGDSTRYNGAEYNNRWGGGGDTAENGYDSGNDRSERQGPCEEGWHVPSGGERNAIVTARCHLDSNNCISSDLKHQSNWTEDYKSIYINNNLLVSSFRSDFEMYNSVWSSSPNHLGGGSERYLHTNAGIIPNATDSVTDMTFHVRCIKDTVEDDEPNSSDEQGNGYGYGYGYGGNGSSTYTVTFTSSPEGYGSVDQTTVTVDKGTAVVVNNNTVTLGTEIVTATPTADTQQYDYSFVNWTNNCGDTVSDNCSIVASFSRTDIIPVPDDSTPADTTPSYSGRGGRSSSSNKDSHNSADDKNTSVDKNETKTSEENKSQSRIDSMDSSKSSNIEAKGQRVPELDMQRYNTTYTPEQNTAYQFAYHNKITTISTIKEAKMNTPLTRIEMAKMLSQYAMNVLGQTPDHSAGVLKFRDVTNKLDAEYDYAVTLAYQLGIMGLNMPNREFRPNDQVSRAEFATALSRMIYDDVEDGTGKVKYYEPHIARLYEEGIISNTNPSLKELRGYVMMMLMRTVE